MLHSFEIMNERRNNRDLRELSFYTADGLIYFLDGSKGYTPKLAITKQPHNLVLRNLEEAFDQLTRHENYYPDTEQASEAIRAGETEVFDLTKLKLHKYNSETSYLTIPTFGGLDNEGLRIAQRVYGHGTDFLKNMKMLKDAGIEETRIYVTSPDYVQKHATKGQFARASWLNNFDYESQFSAFGRYVNYDDRVRGVRKKTDNDQFSAQKSDNSSDFLRRGASAEYRFPTRDEILVSLQPHIPLPLWAGFAETIPVQAQTYGDILQKAVDGKYLCSTSGRPFKRSLRKLFPK